MSEPDTFRMLICCNVWCMKVQMQIACGPGHGFIAGECTFISGRQIMQSDLSGASLEELLSFSPLSQPTRWRYNTLPLWHNCVLCVSFQQKKHPQLHWIVQVCKYLIRISGSVQTHSIPTTFLFQFWHIFAILKQHMISLTGCHLQYPKHDLSPLKKQVRRSNPQALWVNQVISQGVFMCRLQIVAAATFIGSSSIMEWIYA